MTAMLLWIRTIISRLVLTVGLPHMDVSLIFQIPLEPCQPVLHFLPPDNLGTLIQLGVLREVLVALSSDGVVYHY